MREKCDCQRLDCPESSCRDGMIHQCLCGDECDCELPDGKCVDCGQCQEYENRAAGAVDDE